MIDDHAIHEALEAIWSARELERRNIESVQEVSKVILSEELLTSITEAGLAEIRGNGIHLTPRGEEEARQIIRRHRLGAQRGDSHGLGVLVELCRRERCTHVVAAPRHRPNGDNRPRPCHVAAADFSV